MALRQDKEWNRQKVKQEIVIGEGERDRGRRGRGEHGSVDGGMAVCQSI